MGAKPLVGKPMPDFELPGSGGKKVSLKQFKGRPVVLYFYPGDDTPTCTEESCAFAQANAQFKKLDAVVLGVSPDSPKSHDKFIAKYGLPFELLADEGHRLAGGWGLWVEKVLFGKKVWGVQRTTYLIGRDGRLARAWEKVRGAAKHPAEVLEALKEL